MQSPTENVSIQRQSGTDYGLALPDSRNKYVEEATRLSTTAKGMKVEDFVDTLMNTIKKDLLSQGVPEFSWNISRGIGAAAGKFDQKNWLVTIDPDKFTNRDVEVKTLADFKPGEVREVVGTLYHESRHIDQDVLIVRVLLDQKKPVKDIVRETEIPEPIVNKVEENVKAKKFKAPPNAAQTAHAVRMFAVMYGQHKELLTFVMNNLSVVEGVQSLVEASNVNDLKNAAPHVGKVRDWATIVLGPKVKQLGALRRPGPQEKQLKKDLGALSQATTRLWTAYDSASKSLTKARLETLKNAVNRWQRQLSAAINNLESEKEAVAIENLVKRAFDTAAGPKRKRKTKK